MAKDNFYFFISCLSSSDSLEDSVERPVSATGGKTLSLAATSRTLSCLNFVSLAKVFFVLMLNEAGYRNYECSLLNKTLDKILFKILDSEICTSSVREAHRHLRRKRYLSCRLGNFLDNSINIVYSTFLSFLKESMYHLFVLVVNNTYYRVFLMFEDGFSNHTTNSAVNRSGNTRLARWPELKHGYFSSTLAHWGLSSRCLSMGRMGCKTRFLP